MQWWWFESGKVRICNHLMLTWLQFICSAFLILSVHSMYYWESQFTEGSQTNVKILNQKLLNVQNHWVLCWLLELFVELGLTTFMWWNLGGEQQKLYSITTFFLILLLQMSHKIPATALQVAHQKPQPALEKFMLPKRIYIIQQPRKC